MTDLPTLPSIMHGIETWLLSQTEGGEISAPAQTQIDSMLERKPVTPDDLFSLIAFANGCHTVAYEAQTRGDIAQYITFHMYGQIMLINAVNLLGDLAVIALRQIGETQH